MDWSEANARHSAFVDDWNTVDADGAASIRANAWTLEQVQAFTQRLQNLQAEAAAVPLSAGLAMDADVAGQRLYDLHRQLVVLRDEMAAAGGAMSKLAGPRELAPSAWTVPGLGLGGGAAALAGLNIGLLVAVGALAFVLLKRG